MHPHRRRRPPSSPLRHGLLPLVAPRRLWPPAALHQHRRQLRQGTQAPPRQRRRHRRRQGPVRPRGLRSTIRGLGRSPCGPVPRVGRSTVAVQRRARLRPRQRLHSRPWWPPRRPTSHLHRPTSCRLLLGRFCRTCRPCSNNLECLSNMFSRRNRGHRGLAPGISSPLLATSAQ